jgi:hypothetical protein
MSAQDRITLLNAPGKLESDLKQLCDSHPYGCPKNLECLHILAAEWRRRGDEARLCEVIRERRLETLRSTASDRARVIDAVELDVNNCVSFLRVKVCRGTWLRLNGCVCLTCWYA